MDKRNINGQKDVDEIYRLTTDLLYNRKKSPEETRLLLMEKGLDQTNADLVITTVRSRKSEAGGLCAFKDMVYGAFWFVSGGIATISSSLTEWEHAPQVLSVAAILFGGILFIKGLTNRT